MDVRKIIREEIEGLKPSSEGDFEWTGGATPEIGFLETTIHSGTVKVWSDLSFDNVFFIPKDGKNIVVASTNFEYTMWDGEATNEDLVNHFKERTHVEFYNDMNEVSTNFYSEEMDLSLSLDEQIEELIDMSKLDASFSYWKNSLTIKYMDLYHDMGVRNFHRSVEEVIPNIYKILYVKSGM
jgi:hypothetical protein